MNHALAQPPFADAGEPDQATALRVLRAAVDAVEPVADASYAHRPTPTPRALSDGEAEAMVAAEQAFCVLHAHVVLAQSSAARLMLVLPELAEIANKLRELSYQGRQRIAWLLACDMENRVGAGRVARQPQFTMPPSAADYRVADEEAA